MLIDSNIIIYSALPEHQALRDFIVENNPSVSVISYVEVLGYHNLTEQARQYFEEFFAAAQVLPVLDGVTQQAVRLRQTRRRALGDALIAGTALVKPHTGYAKYSGF
jgi:toxin FitB